MNPLQQLLDHGQSFWLDNLTRDLIRSGELGRRVREEGLRGVTSNPSIFAKAIEGSEAYDDQIADLSRQGLAPAEVVERLTIDDVREACDVLRPVYDESQGADGFVSLEVSPHLADDGPGSLADALRLFEAVGRPNAFIKIPGTPAGLPAIEDALAAGVNINITLLFSISSYLAVTEAYQRALERRLTKGEPVDRLSSVASFFVSRIDTMVDKALDELSGSTDEARDLKGQAAIANAKLAYQAFRSVLSSSRWQRLASHGATVQRVLWASTSVKNPEYHDVKYIEPLIGPGTVNTMPYKTAQAFSDHGVVAETVEDGLQEAEQTMSRLAALGIDFEDVTDALLKEGVEKFVVPYDNLVTLVAERCEAARAGGSPRR